MTSTATEGSSSLSGIAVPPKKAWGIATTGTSNDRRPQGLRTIMAEEEEISRANEWIARSKEMEAREDEEIQKAMQASLLQQQQVTATSIGCIEETTPARDGEIDVSAMSEEEQIRRAILLSTTTTAVDDDTTSTAVTTDVAASQAETSSNATAVAAAAAAGAASPGVAARATPAAEDGTGGGLSAEEMEQIERALREADEAAANESLQLALRLVQEDEGAKKVAAATTKRGGLQQQQGHVRTMTRDEYIREQQEGHEGGDNDEYDDDDEDAAEAGYRINSSRQGTAWNRVNQHTIRGPDNQVRTKHDVQLQGQANAHRLHCDNLTDDSDGRQRQQGQRVGNQAYNSFQHKMQKKHMVKGVAAHGHGRAAADAEKTTQGALDARVRLHVQQAINNGLITKFHGCVKEGKEALVFYAENQKPTGNTDDDDDKDGDGFDVAVKVFKRIQEFRNRGEYISGDPRFTYQDYKCAGQREQLEIWAEKEYRNLVRAHRSGVPVPEPLWYKENVVFLRFLGEDGWPSPQLRELQLQRHSKKWTTLYEQAIRAVRALYGKAKLVHGDLSEYNILVCPGHLLLNNGNSNKNDDEENENNENASDEKNKNSKEKKDDDGLQVALIDFGQAVHQRHPNAHELLLRDVTRVGAFFTKMGVKTRTLQQDVDLIQQQEQQQEEESNNQDDEDVSVQQERRARLEEEQAVVTGEPIEVTQQHDA